MTQMQALIKMLPGDIDAALIASPQNRHYYTGFVSSAGTLLLMREKSYFIVDSRYSEAAGRSVRDAEVIEQDKLYVQISELLKRHGVKTVALENDACTLEAFATYREKLPDVTLLDDARLSGLIRGQRQIKSEAELRSIGEAQALTEKAFNHILDYIRPGKTEIEIALELEFYSRMIGSEGVAFEFIVVSGKNSSMPHGVPTGKPVEEGDLLTMDFGLVVNGYRSDMTRTVGIVRLDDKQREVYDTVLRAQNAAFEKIAPDVPCVEVDRAARELIDASPYAGRFGHGLGHSLGLEIHEPPRFSPESEAVLRQGMVMSVEPGIYLPGEFGVRIEDIITVTADGYQNLTSAPKELIVL